MRIDFVETGKKNAPILVCIHSFMGSPTEFDSFVERFQGQFYIIVVDLNPNIRAVELAANEARSAEKIAELNFDIAHEKIAQYLLERHAGKKAVFVGFSFGGKVIFELLKKFPLQAEAAFVVDMGLGLITESELFRFADQIIPQINLDSDWKDIRQEFAKKISDRSIRVVLQMQIREDSLTGKKSWNAGLFHLRDLIFNLKLTSQWEILEDLQAPVEILQAETFSAIQPKDAARMRENPKITLQEVPKSSHYLFLTHQGKVIEYFENFIKSLKIS